MDVAYFVLNLPSVHFNYHPQSLLYWGVPFQLSSSISALHNQVFNKINSLRQVSSERQSTIFLGSLGVGFGNLSATAANIPPGTEQIKSPEAAEMLVNAASTCCSRLLDRCCCGCFIQACSHVNGQCYIVLSQLCAALACFECLNCCYELCECM